MNDCEQSLVSSGEGIAKHNNAVHAVYNLVVDYKVLVHTFCINQNVLNRLLVFTFCHSASSYNYVHCGIFEVWLRQLKLSTISVKLIHERFETELSLDLIFFYQLST